MSRFADPRERGIRHRRIERGTVFPHALAHRVVELFEGVPADAVFFIRRDIGGVDGADRRLHRQTAGERFPCFAVGVAGDTVPRPRQILPLLNQIAVRRRLFGEGRAAQCPQAPGPITIAFSSSAFLYACTRGPGFFRYCSRIAFADQ